MYFFIESCCIFYTCYWILLLIFCLWLFCIDIHIWDWSMVFFGIVNLFQIATGRSLGIHSQVCNAFLVKCLCFYFGKFKNKYIFGAHLNNLHLKHCMVISFILDCPESSFEFFLNGFSCNTLGKNLNKLFVQPNTSIILFSMNWRYFNKIWN